MVLVKKKIKYRAWFFIKQDKSRRLAKKKRFNPVKKKGLVIYKGVSYEPILGNPTFDNGIKRYFFFDIGTKAQISTYEISTIESDAEIKDLLYIQEVMKQGFEAIKEKGLIINWIHLVLTAIACISAGWILGNYIPIGVLP